MPSTTYLPGMPYHRRFCWICLLGAWITGYHGRTSAFLTDTRRGGRPAAPLQDAPCPPPAYQRGCRGLMGDIPRHESSGHASMGLPTSLLAGDFTYFTFLKARRKGEKREEGRRRNLLPHCEHLGRWTISLGGQFWTFVAWDASTATRKRLGGTDYQERCATARL